MSLSLTLPVERPLDLFVSLGITTIDPLRPPHLIRREEAVKSADDSGEDGEVCRLDGAHEGGPQSVPAFIARHEQC